MIFVVEKVKQYVMKKKSIYKIHIYNDDGTTIYVIATTKLDASFKYAEWVKEQGKDYDVDETTDFEIEFALCAYDE